MAALIAKLKKNKRYYYVVESARVNGQPRIVQQTYLGSAQKVAALVKDRTAPVPVSASFRELGLPGSLWLAAQDTGVFQALHSFWPEPRSGPSPAHYLLLAAIQRICRPGPKTEVAGWYAKTVLFPTWGFPAERFTSQAFGDCFEQILPEPQSRFLNEDKDPLEEAQQRLLALWKDRAGGSRRVLAYDTTNFYTFIASTNERNTLAQRGHQKQGRHDLRQVGLSYALDGDCGMALCHHVYPGQLADAEEFPVALDRILRMLDRNAIPRESVTLVLDKGPAALANTVLMRQARVGWISALPWNQAPPEFRARDVNQLPACGDAQPGVQAAAEKTLVHGEEYLCVLKYSGCFAAEQLHSLATTLSKVTQQWRSLATELSRPGCRLTEGAVRRKINRWLSAAFLAELVQYQLHAEGTSLCLQFQINHPALETLYRQRLGRTLLITNRLDWSAEQVVAAYSGQQHIEQVFRGLKGGDWLPWGPMHHWTDSKIRIHAFYCLLGISLLNHVHRQAQQVWPQLTTEKLKGELQEIGETVLLYPPQEKGPYRTVTVLSCQSLIQKTLAETLALHRVGSTHRG
jgi:transposase